jgi:hypothetical protein
MKKLSIVHFDKNKQLWKIITGKEKEYSAEVFLRDVTFFVNTDGQKIIRKQVAQGQSLFEARFPHAYAIGEQVDLEDKNFSEGEFQEFRYDVIQDKSFVLTSDKQPIYAARAIYLNDNKMLALV